MIAYPRGWPDFLLRRCGGLAATLHTHLTGNTFRVGDRTLAAESLHCLPSYRPFRWFRNPHIPRLSFVTQETQVFLQIALTICLRYLRLTQPATLGAAHLVLPSLPFPAIGWRAGSIQVMCCRRYPSQALKTFAEDLEKKRKQLRLAGITSRWIVPHTLVYPKPARLGDWPEVDAESLAFLPREDLDDAFFFLDLAGLYRILLSQRQDLS